MGDTLASVLVSENYCNEVSQTEWLKQQKGIVTVWRLEVQDQDVNGTGSFSGL